jgi:hypothetical protein
VELRAIAGESVRGFGLGKCVAHPVTQAIPAYEAETLFVELAE